MIRGQNLRARMPVGVLGAGMALAATAILGPLSALAGIAVAGMALVLVNPGAAVPLLISVSALNRYGYTWGDAQIRVEILVAILLTVTVANRLAVRTLSASILRSPVALPLTAYTVVNVMSTLLFAQEVTRGLKLDAEIAATLMVFLSVVSYLSNWSRIRSAISALWWVSVGEALIGLTAVLAYVLHLSTFGVQFDPFGLPMVFGTQWEANIFGSFLLGNFFVLLADYFEAKRSRIYAVGLVMVVAGIGVSLTRTVWLALVLGCFLFALLLFRLRRPGMSMMPILVAVPVLALGGLVLGSATPLAGRLLDLLNLQSSSASGRIVWFQAALRDWAHSPILGTGTGSFNYGAVPGAPHPWLPNLFLLTLHDTGVVGLLVLALVLTSIYRTLFRALRRDPTTAVLTAGIITSVTSLLIAFQTTSGFWFAYFWIITGIGVAVARHPALAPDRP